MDMQPPDAIEFTPLHGLAAPECLEDIVMQLDALSSPSAYDIEANHKVADYLLCLALKMLPTSESSVNDVITAFNRIKKAYV